MRFRLTRWAGLLAPALALALSAFGPDKAQAQTPDEIIKRGKVVIAIDTTVPPYGMLDSSNQPAGIDIDVANLIGKQLKVPVEFVTVNSPGRIPALLSNRVDMVIAIFSITPERALQVAFSIPYAGQSAVLIAPKTTSIKTPDELKNLKVGVTRGALEDGALTAMNVPGMQLLRFDDGPSTVQAMLSGQIDAMGGGDYGEIYLRKGSKGEEYEQKFPLRAAHFGIGIRRGNPELLQWLNTFVYSIKNTGELDAISRKWRNGAPMIPLPVF
ncbi:transporter substrate-binding domain-containing protein [Alsobacter sp. SYSU M60028]|uniref:Transporter substrate-binding domain-containing protein n=1 Tax=Alsobacter ponti TaxID=2962936 RepID=A0ABT1LG08_9HYPH|nr:transporter substrate-binding domain-containing protein [Alsobacter ponti]MCP8940033.1 transporter substrate-binding domain-containing protein [Alsobacter ponti]